MPQATLEATLSRLANAQNTNAVNAATVTTIADTRHVRRTADARQLCHRATSALSASTPVVSRSLELSFQSSLQLSLTVLVCYRIRIRI